MICQLSTSPFFTARHSALSNLQITIQDFLQDYRNLFLLLVSFITIAHVGPVKPGRQAHSVALAETVKQDPPFSQVLVLHAFGTAQQTISMNINICRL